MDGPSAIVDARFLTWPFVFLDIPGCHTSVRAENATTDDRLTSLHNEREAESVALLVKLLAVTAPPGQLAHSIGIITPYKQQVKHIKLQLARLFPSSQASYGNATSKPKAAAGVPDILRIVDVNTVDGFQGQVQGPLSVNYLFHISLGKGHYRI
jgi:AAA domain